MKSPLLFLSITTALAYFVMYRQLLSPSDETGHAIGWLVVSVLWALVNFVNLLRLFICRRDRLRHGALILMLPAAWLMIQYVFFQIFYTQITKTHPGWNNGRVPDLAEDGIAMVLVSTALTILGGLLIFMSGRMNRSTTD